MKSIKFRTIVIIRSSGGRQKANVIIPRDVWQNNKINTGDRITANIVGREFESRVAGEEQKVFSVPADISRELRLRDSESIEVEIKTE